MPIGDKLSVSSKLIVPAKGVPGSALRVDYDFSVNEVSRMPILALYLSIVTAWTIIVL